MAVISEVSAQNVTPLRVAGSRNTWDHAEICRVDVMKQEDCSGMLLEVESGYMLRCMHHRTSMYMGVPAFDRHDR